METIGKKLKCKNILFKDYRTGTTPSPTELILSSLRIFVCFLSSSGCSAWAPESFGSGAESSEACNVLEASPVTPKLSLENIYIYNLHDFKTTFPGLDVSKQPLGSFIRLLYVCGCVHMHIKSVKHENISICKLLVWKWVLTSWYLMFVRALARYTPNSRKPWQVFAVLHYQTTMASQNSCRYFISVIYTPQRAHAHEEVVLIRGVMMHIFNLAPLASKLPSRLEAVWMENKES